MMNGLAHNYELDEPAVRFRGIRIDFKCLFHFSSRERKDHR